MPAKKSIAERMKEIMGAATEPLQAVGHRFVHGAPPIPEPTGINRAIPMMNAAANKLAERGGTPAAVTDIAQFGGQADPSNPGVPPGPAQTPAQRIQAMMGTATAPLNQMGQRIIHGAPDSAQRGSGAAPVTDIPEFGGMAWPTNAPQKPGQQPLTPLSPMPGRPADIASAPQAPQQPGAKPPMAQPPASGSRYLDIAMAGNDAADAYMKTLKPEHQPIHEIRGKEQSWWDPRGKGRHASELEAAFGVNKIDAMGKHAIDAPGQAQRDVAGMNLAAAKASAKPADNFSLTTVEGPAGQGQRVAKLNKTTGKLEFVDPQNPTQVDEQLSQALRYINAAENEDEALKRLQAALPVLSLEQKQALLAVFSKGKK